MSEAINLSTLGVRVAWGVEQTAGTMPTTSLQYLPSITSTPELNPTPDTIDVTDLSQTEYKQYVQGLKDLGGAISFGANLTALLIDVWDNQLMAKYKSANAEGKRIWFFIIHPSLEKAMAFACEPSAQGLPAIEVNGALTTNVNVTPQNQPRWVTKPTSISEPTETSKS
jgi:hypothetical protein